MHIVAILGSRNPQGRTAQAAQALLQGASEAGSTTETIFLTEKQIERCRQCEDTGWGICRTEGRCVIEDDFAAVVEKIRAAEAVVFATPVYFSDLSESIRAFLERLRRTCMHAAGGHGIGDKPAVGICVAGGGGGGAPSCIVSLERIVARCGFDIVDLIPARRQNLEMKKDVLELVGRWLTTCPSSR